ncbi:MAG: 30S ribosomal protein S11 [Candidatus Omnitrophica bacterium]|nr:30S ribosomal protein S11 [Candidatus Omnitrophota bacterium]
MAKKPKRKERKKKKVVLTSSAGIATVKATFNNTIISITDPNGNVLAWKSAGGVGFKGARKSTPYAAQIASLDVAKTTKAMGLREVDVMIKGPGPGREAAIRALSAAGLNVKRVKVASPAPHNGCRLKKKRRV